MGVPTPVCCCGGGGAGGMRRVEEGAWGGGGGGQESLPPEMLVVAVVVGCAVPSTEWECLSCGGAEGVVGAVRAQSVVVVGCALWSMGRECVYIAPAIECFPLSIRPVTLSSVSPSSAQFATPRHRRSFPSPSVPCPWVVVLCVGSSFPHVWPRIVLSGLAWILPGGWSYSPVVCVLSSSLVLGPPSLPGMCLGAFSSCCK